MMKVESLERRGPETEAFFVYLERPTRRRLARVVRLYQAHLWNVALRVTGNQEDAADVCQDVLLSLLLRPPTPDQVRSPRGYLAFRVLTLAERLSRAARRRHQREIEAAQRLRAESDSAFQDLEALREAVRSLPERPRACIELRYLAGLRVREIAEHLDLSERTVESDLQEGKEILRRRLAGTAGGGVLILENMEKASAAVPPRRLEEDLLRIVSLGRALSPGVGAAVGGLILMKKWIALAALLAVLLLSVWTFRHAGGPATSGPSPPSPLVTASPATGEPAAAPTLRPEAAGQAAPQAAPGKMVLVSGFVLDRDCAPVAGAQVHAAYRDSMVGEARSADDGSFSVSWARPDSFWPSGVILCARKQGFAAGWAQPKQGMDRPSGDVAFEGILIILSQGPAAISGRVQDENGEPIPGATVRALAVSGGFQTPVHILAVGSFAAIAASTSDGEGLFEINDLSPATAFDLAIEHPNHLPGRFRHVVPGGLRLPYVLETAGVSVEGQVVDPAGQGVAGAAVRVLQVLEDRFPTADPFLRQGQTDPEGIFRFRVAPWLYKVSIEPPAGFERPEAELIEVMDDVRGYRIILQPRPPSEEVADQLSTRPVPQPAPGSRAKEDTARIWGIVSGPDGVPVPAVVTLSETLSLKGFVDSRMEVETGLDGRFELGWPADRLPVRLVAASPWRGFYGERVVARPEEGADLRLRLERCDESTVRGVVVDHEGRPMRGAGIVVSRSYDGGTRPAGAARAGGDGGFFVRNLVPWTGYWFTPVVDGEYGPSVIALLSPGETALTVPVPAREASLRGTVRDRQGTPLPGLEISYEYKEDDTIRCHYASTDKEGNFAIPEVFPGMYQVVLDNRGYSFWAKEVETADPPLEIVLLAARKVSFEVVTPNGDPITMIGVSGEAQSPPTRGRLMWSDDGLYSEEVPETETKLIIEAYWGDHPKLERPLVWPPSGNIDLGRLVAGRD